MHGSLLGQHMHNSIYAIDRARAGSHQPGAWRIIGN
jgi:hypothetical protein